MSDEMVKEILQRVDLLAAKLGIGADALWAVLLRQARIQFVAEMLFIVAVAIGWFVIFRYGIPATKRMADRDSDAAPAVFIGNAIAVVILSIFTVSAVFSSPDTMAALLNPEYWAFKQLANFRR